MAPSAAVDANIVIFIAIDLCVRAFSLAICVFLFFLMSNFFSRNIHRVPPHCTLSFMQNPALRSKWRKRYAWSHDSLYFAILIQQFFFVSFLLGKTIHFFLSCFVVLC